MLGNTLQKSKKENDVSMGWWFWFLKNFNMPKIIEVYEYKGKKFEKKINSRRTEKPELPGFLVPQTFWLCWQNKQKFSPKYYWLAGYGFCIAWSMCFLDRNRVQRSSYIDSSGIHFINMCEYIYGWIKLQFIYQNINFWNKNTSNRKLIILS